MDVLILAHPVIVVPPTGTSAVSLSVCVAAAGVGTPALLLVSANPALRIAGLAVARLCQRDPVCSATNEVRDVRATWSFQV